MASLNYDGGEEREHFIGSVYIEDAHKNDSWQNADFFGVLTLVE
jgi:hypothetical protein